VKGDSGVLGWKGYKGTRVRTVAEAIEECRMFKFLELK
jgi:hypothetical protein